ncbi:MAG: hypothetical protein ACD_4C00397G0001 [uncultured bacterium (gcode 4)]|uniref:Uncharacterized protein n=1 Tax=uncultured bacterium (gcode 4) TaxID=1234023 RepID=K2FWD3_9BACT|nr:MAG: hypothetical protein ACD_4C00397G0001 [uncultured bacterium (gcode 4)]
MTWRFSFGTSIQTSHNPGIGAWIRILFALSARVRSFLRFSILFNFTHSAGLRRYCITVGQTVYHFISTSILNWRSVFLISRDFCSTILSSISHLFFITFKRSAQGKSQLAKLRDVWTGFSSFLSFLKISRIQAFSTCIFLGSNSISFFCFSGFDFVSFSSSFIFWVKSLTSSLYSFFHLAFFEFSFKSFFISFFTFEILSLTAQTEGRLEWMVFKNWI